MAGAIQASLGEGDLLERLARTAALLEDLDPEDLPDVVAVYERMIPSIDPRDLAMFFSAWARFDPAGALDYALAWPRRSMLEQRRIGLRGALAGWAYADSSQARIVAEEVAKQHAPLRADVWNGLVAGWARSGRDLEGLGAFLTDLRPRHQRDAAADVAARELVRAGGADAALEWADTILGGESQDQGFKRKVFESSLRAAVAYDPSRTGAWALEHAEAAYAVDGPVIAARRWGRVDGAVATRGSARPSWRGQRPIGGARRPGWSRPR
jgi:hypothetical protein